MSNSGKNSNESKRRNNIISSRLTGNLVTQEKNTEYRAWEVIRLQILNNTKLEGPSDTSQWSGSASPSKPQFQDGNIEGKVIGSNNIRENLKINQEHLGYWILEETYGE